MMPSPGSRDLHFRSSSAEDASDGFEMTGVVTAPPKRVKNVEKIGKSSGKSKKALEKGKAKSRHKASKTEKRPEAHASDSSNSSPPPLFRAQVSSSQAVLDGSSDITSDDERVGRKSRRCVSPPHRSRPAKVKPKSNVKRPPPCNKGSVKSARRKSRSTIVETPSRDTSPIIVLDSEHVTCSSSPPRGPAAKRKKRKEGEFSDENEPGRLDEEESLYDSDRERGLGRWTAEDRDALASTYLHGKDTTQDFDLEGIIDFRAHPRKGYNCYRVKWKDFSDLFNTWEPSIMFNETDAVEDFWAAYEKSGHKRPMNATKAYEESVTSSAAERDSEDTELEVALIDRERSRSARKRMIKDIRKDRAIVNGYRQPGCRTKDIQPPAESPVESSEVAPDESERTRKRAKTVSNHTSSSKQCTTKSSQIDANMEASRSRQQRGQQLSPSRRPFAPPAEGGRRASLPQVRSGGASGSSKQITDSRSHSLDNYPASPPMLNKVNALDYLTVSDAVIKHQRRKEKERQRELNKEAEAEAKRERLKNTKQFIDVCSSDDEDMAEDTSDAGSSAQREGASKTNAGSSGTSLWKGKHHVPGKAKTLDGEQIGSRQADPTQRSACKKYRMNPLDFVGKTQVPVPEHISSALKRAPAKGILSSSKEVSTGEGARSTPRRARFQPDELTPPISDRAPSENLKEHADTTQIDMSGGWDAGGSDAGDQDTNVQEVAGWNADDKARAELRGSGCDAGGWDADVEMDVSTMSQPYLSGSADQTMTRLAAQIAETSVAYDYSAGWDEPMQADTVPVERALVTEVRSDNQVTSTPRERPSLPPKRRETSASQLPRIDSGIVVSSTRKNSVTDAPMTPKLAKASRFNVEEVKKFSINSASKIDEIKRAYNLVLDKGDPRRSLRDVVIEFILFCGGGYKPEITDSMRQTNIKTFIWLHDLTLPSDPVQKGFVREALDLPHFRFLTYNEHGKSYEAFPVDQGKVRMLTFGALMYKLGKICAQPAGEGEGQEDEVARYKAAWLEDHVEDHLYVHPWQRLALERLLIENRLADFYEDAFAMEHEAEATDLAISVAAHGRSALAVLEEVPIEMTYAPNETPLQAPNLVEEMPNVHKLSLDLDREVHKTLLRLQRRWWDKRRGFLLTLMATSLLPEDLGVCHDVIRYHKEIDKPECYFSD